MKEKKLRTFSALAIATVLGVGFFPVAPGTAGSLVGVALASWTGSFAWQSRILLWVLVFFVGTWSAKVVDEVKGSNDNQHIVIDEVLGMGIASWTAGDEMMTWIVVFLLFRFFDILKLPPVRQVDRWSKIQAKGVHPLARWYGGFGVMADDVLAGIQGLIVIILLQWLSILPYS